MTNLEMEWQLLGWIKILRGELPNPTEPEIQRLLRSCPGPRYLVFASKMATTWADEMQKMVDSLRRKT